MNLSATSERSLVSPTSTPARRPRSTIAMILVVVLALTALVACKRGESGAAAADAAMKQTKALNQRVVKEWPRLETEIDPLRSTQPAEAAARIRKDLVPMFGELAASYETAATAIEAYVATAGDEKATSVEKLRANATIARTAATACAQVRDAYAKEATLLDRGPLAAADFQALVEERMNAMKALAPPS